MFHKDSNTSIDYMNNVLTVVDIRWDDFFRSSDEFLSVYFYSNSHLDMTKYYIFSTRTSSILGRQRDYFISLANNIRQTPDAFAHREVHNLTIK